MDNNIFFIYINLNRCENRKQKIEKMFNSYNIKNYIRVEAIDYQNKHYSNEIRNLVSVKKELLGKKLSTNIENYPKISWVYDGSIKNSWPNMPYNCKYGERGLILSYIKALQKAKEINSEYVCILEDDAWFSKKNFEKLKIILSKTNYKVIFLDERQNSSGIGIGCAGMIYHKSIIDKIINIIHPLSNLKLSFQNWSYLIKKINPYFPKIFINLAALDVFFTNYFILNKKTIKVGIFKMVKSDYFPTTIQNS